MNKTLTTSDLEWLKAASYTIRVGSEIDCTITLLNEELIRIVVNPLAEYSLTDTDGDFVVVSPSPRENPRPKLESLLIKHNLKKKKLEDFIFNLAKDYYNLW